MLFTHVTQGRGMRNSGGRVNTVQKRFCAAIPRARPEEATHSRWAQGRADVSPRILGKWVPTRPYAPTDMLLRNMSYIVFLNRTWRSRSLTLTGRIRECDLHNLQLI